MGFSGMMTAVQLMRKASGPLQLILIDPRPMTGRGVAYVTNSDRHLLNVPAGRMSAFPDQPHHFLDYVCRHPSYQDIQRDILERAFLPRNLYGEYLSEAWQNALASRPSQVEVKHVQDTVMGMSLDKGVWEIRTLEGQWLLAEEVVIATGNELPFDPPLDEGKLSSLRNYFRNPWSPHCSEDSKDLSKVLVIGNGLTMVDVVVSLLEQGFKGEIVSVSPHGYIMLPHRFAGVTYTALKEELKEPYEIGSLFRLFRKHIDRLRKVGLSAEPVVDSIRSISQEVWQKLSLDDKRRFLAHLRHLWGVARHRLPAQQFDLIQELKAEGRLKIVKGRVATAQAADGRIQVKLRLLPGESTETLLVDRIINCTGPQLDVSRTENPLLLDLFQQGILQPDPLRLGIHTTTEGALIHADGTADEHVFALGGHLRGLLWESTAVPELRLQAERLAERLLR